MWDYTEAASAFTKRPDYAHAAVDTLVQTATGGRDAVACDVGAGTGNLTRLLVAHGVRVVAVEPNAAMRRIGKGRPDLAQVQWWEGRGEATRLPASAFDLVTFGSSFNVVDRASALRESARILRGGGWFACLWNHRDLDDPLQARIEAFIHAELPRYHYGTRRENQAAFLERSDLFCDVHRIDRRVEHRLRTDDWLEAWRSHVTLRRQAGIRWPAILAGIDALTRRYATHEIEVGYTTRVWMARRVRHFA